MTRETKVGLIVAGSFLCLVSIVIVSKLRDGDAAADHEEQTVQVAAVKPTQNQTKPEAKKSAPAKSAKGTITIVPQPPAPQTAAKDPKQDATPAFPPVGGLPPLGTSAEDDKIKEQLRLAAAQNQGPSAPRPLQIGDLPAPPGGEFKLPPLDNKPPSSPVESKGPAFPSVSLPKSSEGPGGIQFPQPPLGQVDDKKNEPVAPLDTKKPGGLDALPAPPSLGGLGTGQPPVEPKEPKLVFPKREEPAQVPPGFPPLKPADPLLTPGDLGGNPVTPKDNQPPRVVFPQKEVQTEKPPITPPLTPPVSIAPPRTFDKEPPNGQTIPTIPSKDPERSLPSAPSITVPGNKPLMPVVKDVNADFYTCRSGETNFAIVSLVLYKNDKYADALLAYNRDHNRLLGNGDSLLRSPPTLAPGQQVLHPPVGILERDYRALIREPSGSVAPPIPSVTPPVQLARPAPLGGNPGVTPASVQPVTPSGRIYNVQNPAGESILDIAERALGNRSEWFRIHELNRQYPPQFRIPAGTQLKLP